MKFYYALNDQVIRGPVGAESLLQMREEGTLQDDSPVIAHGEQVWSTYAAKAALLQQPPRAAVPPPRPEPAQTAQRVSHKPTETATPGKRLISYAGGQVAAGAVESKDEFASGLLLQFPSLTAGQGLLATDPTTPTSWSFFLRVSVQLGGASRFPQLYIVVSNQPKQGLVLYNHAALSGGEPLEVTHINSDRKRLSDTSWVEEHLGIALTPALLARHLDRPMRIKVSRPNEGISFVVELPAYYIEGVLARLDPEKYEVDPASAPVPGKEATGHGWQAVAAGVAVGVVFMFKGGFLAGVLTGLFAGAAMYGVIVYQRKKASPA